MTALFYLDEHPITITAGPGPEAPEELFVSYRKCAKSPTYRLKLTFDHMEDEVAVYRVTERTAQ